MVSLRGRLNFGMSTLYLSKWGEFSISYSLHISCQISDVSVVLSKKWLIVRFFLFVLGNFKGLLPLSLSWFVGSTSLIVFVVGIAVAKMLAQTSVVEEGVV